MIWMLGKRARGIWIMALVIWVLGEFLRGGVRVVVVGGETAAFRSRKSIQAALGMSLGGGGGWENRGPVAAADCRVIQDVP